MENIHEEHDEKWEDYQLHLLLVAYGFLLLTMHMLLHAIVRPSPPPTTKDKLESHNNGDSSKASSSSSQEVVEVIANRHRYANRIISGSHSTFMAVVAIRCGFVWGYDLQGEKFLDLPALERFVLGAMMPYLLYDTCHLLWRYFILHPSLGIPESWTLAEHTLPIIHHVLVFGTSGLIYVGTGAVYSTQLVSLGEISTTLLNIRWLIMKEGITSGPWYVTISILSMVCFFVFRVPVSAFLVYKTYDKRNLWQSRWVWYYQMFSMLAYFIMNTSWFIIMIQIAIRTVSSSSSSSSPSPTTQVSNGGGEVVSPLRIHGKKHD